MKTLPVLTICLAAFLISDARLFAAGDALDPSLVGRYMKGGGDKDYFDIRADGTYTIAQGSEGATGDYTAQGNTLTLGFPGGRSIVLMIANGTFTGPDKELWRKVPGVEPGPPPANLPNFSATKSGGAAAANNLAEKGKITLSINHVRQICVACQLWADKHNGKFPERLRDLLADGYLGKGQEQIFQCPLLGPGEKFGYYYNGNKFPDTAPGSKIIVLSHWVAADGSRIAGHKDGSVRLEVPKREDLPDLPAARERAAKSTPKTEPSPTPPDSGSPKKTPPVVTGGTPEPSADLPIIKLTVHEAPKMKPDKRYRVSLHAKSMPSAKENYSWIVDPPSHVIETEPLVHDFIHVHVTESGVYKITLQHHEGLEKRTVSNVVEVTVP